MKKPKSTVPIIYYCTISSNNASKPQFRILFDTESRKYKHSSEKLTYIEKTMKKFQIHKCETVNTKVRR